MFSLLPLVAAVLAVPQFLPQFARLRRTGETAGVSWSWAALLIAAAGLSGRGGLGTALTAAFLLQVTPSVWTAYRAVPSGSERRRGLLRWCPLQAVSDTFWRGVGH
jgi:hypothetical protein